MEDLLEVLEFLLSDECLDTHKILILDGLASVLPLNMTKVNTMSSHFAHSCVQLLRQIANQKGVVVLLSNIAMTKNEKTRDKASTFVELPDRSWRSLMDNRFYISKTMSLNADDSLFYLDVQILKSRYLKTSLGCRLCATNCGFVE